MELSSGGVRYSRQTMVGLKATLLVAKATEVKRYKCKLVNSHSQIPPRYLGGFYVTVKYPDHVTFVGWVEERNPTCFPWSWVTLTLYPTYENILCKTYMFPEGFMSQSNIQSFNAEDLSAEELQLQKAQQVIDELFMAAESDEKLNEQLEAAISPESLVEIATRQGYKLTVADLEMLHHYDQEQAQLNSDELDDDELSEQELELVAGGRAKGLTSLTAPPKPVPSGFNPSPKSQGFPVPWWPW